MMALISSIEVSLDTSKFNTTKEPLGTEHVSHSTLVYLLVKAMLLQLLFLHQSQ
jgi:hypothetical protein